MAGKFGLRRWTQVIISQKRIPLINRNECKFLISQVRLCVTHSRLRWVYLSDYNFAGCLYKVCIKKTLFGYRIFPSAYSLQCTQEKKNWFRQVAKLLQDGHEYIWDSFLPIKKMI